MKHKIKINKKASGKLQPRISIKNLETILNQPPYQKSTCKSKSTEKSNLQSGDTKFSNLD